MRDIAYFQTSIAAEHGDGAIGWAMAEALRFYLLGSHRVLPLFVALLGATSPDPRPDNPWPIETCPVCPRVSAP